MVDLQTNHFNTMRLTNNMKSDMSLTIDQDTSLAYHQRSFHGTMKYAIVMAQFFGVMPLHEITAKNLHDVKFKWKSLRVLFSIYSIIGAFITIIFCFVKFAVFGFEIDKTGPLIFYISNFFGNLQFIQIARNWPTILREWSLVEMSMRSYGFLPNLSRKYIFIASVIMGLALVEHLLFILNSLFDSQQCENYDLHPTETYFGTAFPHYFSLISYSPWVAVFTEIANVLCTFSWNFSDLFIILISISLTARFKQISRKLETNKVMHEKFWKEIREDYNKVAHLARVVDRHLAPLVLISYMNNIFFLCIQLYNSIKERIGIVETVYFFYSFGFLVARTLAVSMYGAWLNDETKKPLEVLYSVPSEHYCVEITRLTEQINSSPLGISGSKFFIVTRTFVLQMAGTIITFELMIFQFGPINRNDHRVFDCIT